MRCFVAVDLPEEIKRGVPAIQQAFAMNGLKLVDPNLVHITLKFLGEVEERRVDDIVNALARVRFSPFQARITGVGAFPGRSIRVIWLGATGPFEELARAVDTALEPFGFERDKKFSAHATLARVKDPSLSRILAERLSGVSEVDLGAFTVERFVLKKSTLTPRGPVYEDIAEFRASQ
ncbi:RNA 2',3'-cyclic phosphodiesterase [Methanothrix thermoacetophila]|uniref:RNA 2',3'-cyclic phosphodiesterase n=1 Tax=Methanothrix thermoacetophila (strain DSM 6194 / JCM 14653 / NBRC 101360 / PT) TaxID=349307 RepID=A0B6Z0_METTP|nr:RNA 2',3'-cyclic phosphodiesterase [Methanothrix thermoacetophila]ABK14464.1 2'-5' RNA ligase [Methanothrix thermoacetophila PT]